MIHLHDQDSKNADIGKKDCKFKQSQDGLRRLMIKSIAGEESECNLMLVHSLERAACVAVTKA